MQQSDDWMPLSRPLFGHRRPPSALVIVVVDDARQNNLARCVSLIPSITSSLTMPEAGPSKISSGSLLDLKALTAEHKERFEKEGRSAVKGQARNKPISKVCSVSSPTCLYDIAKSQATDTRFHR